MYAVLPFFFDLIISGITFTLVTLEVVGLNETSVMKIKGIDNLFFLQTIKMADEGFDPCECVWSHDMAMRRLLSLVSSGADFTADLFYWP